MTNARNSPKNEKARFYMSAYLLDAICAQKQYLGMSWTWAPKEFVINIYFKFFYDCSYRGVMARLTGHFIIMLYKLIVEQDPPCMSREVMGAVVNITDWYASLGSTFIIVFSREKSPHVLQRYATDNLIMQEVSYHLSIGLLAGLHRKKKAPWPSFPLRIGLYDIKSLKDVYVEAKEIVKFNFETKDFNLYYLHGIYKDHCVRVYFSWIHRACHWPEEDPWRYCYNASKIHETVSIETTWKAALQIAATLEATRTTKIRSN